MTARHGGFTLLEILVVLVVLGLLMAALAGGIDFGLRSWQGQSRVIDRSADLQTSDDAIRRLVAQADPGLDVPRADLDGDAHQLSFTTRLPDGAGGERAVHVALGVDASHRLVLTWSPAPYARRLTPPPSARQEVLLNDVAGLDVSYEGPAGWVQAWSGTTLPTLVRLRLGFPAGSGRSWPDIIAAPTRESVPQ